MEQFSSMFNGLTRSFSSKKQRRNSKKNGGIEAAEAMAYEAKKNCLILKSSGTVNVDNSKNFAAVFTRRGEKGINQDCCIVWEKFGCQEDMILCGIFDGHGQWGHFVAKRVRELLPYFLLCNWQETLTEGSIDPDFIPGLGGKLNRNHIWKQSYLKACASVDHELQHQKKFDSFNSGTTGLTILRQGDLISVANVGDSRAVLGTTSSNGSLMAVQLTIDFKPNLQQETERIIHRNGRVFCLDDEPGIHRLWLPDQNSPGLAMSRAFGDFCVKDFGLSSVPDVIHRHITTNDQFIVLASDGVWDVISNEEAVEIVSSVLNKAKSAKRLVEAAVKAWKLKRKCIAMDDISAIVLHFHHLTSSSVNTFK